MTAHAQTFDVKQVEVQQGELSLDFDASLFRGLPRGGGANRSAHDQTVHYGLREWWKLSGVFKLENPDDERVRFARVAVENIFVLKPLDDHKPFDTGLGWFAAVEVSTHAQTTNAVVFGPILSMTAGKLSITANPFLEKTFGRNREDGLAFNYGWQVKYDLREGFAVGIEGFGLIDNIGHAPPWSEQEHRVGPVVYKEVEIAKDVKITPDIGVLFGLTKATPDVAVKLHLGIPLHKQAAHAR